MYICTSEMPKTECDLRYITANHFYFHYRCWNVNRKDGFFWIIKGPILLTVLVSIQVDPSEWNLASN